MYRERPARRSPTGAQRVAGETPEATASRRREAARRVVAARERRSAASTKEWKHHPTKVPMERRSGGKTPQLRQEARGSVLRRQLSASPRPRRPDPARPRPVAPNTHGAADFTRGSAHGTAGDGGRAAVFAARPHSAARLRPSTSRPAWRPSGVASTGAAPRTPAAGRVRAGGGQAAANGDGASAAAPASATRLKWSSPDPAHVRARASALRQRLQDLLSEVGPSLSQDSAAAAALNRTRDVVMRAERAFCGEAAPRSPPPSVGDPTSVFARSAGSRPPGGTHTPNPSLRRVGGGFDDAESEATYRGRHAWREYLRATVHGRGGADGGDPLQWGTQSEEEEEEEKEPPPPLWRASAATLVAVGHPSPAVAESAGDVSTGPCVTDRQPASAPAPAAT